MGRDGHYYQAAVARGNQRAACGKGVSGRPGCGGNDEAIPLNIGNFFACNRVGAVDDATLGATSKGELIQAEKLL